MVLKYGLNERQARAVIRLPESKRETAVREIYLKQMNSTQTDKYVEDLLVEYEEQLKPKPKIIDKTNPYTVIGLYINSFNKTVEAMKSAGIHCDLEKRQTEESNKIRRILYPIFAVRKQKLMQLHKIIVRHA